jgi:hypothetical protein
VSDQKGPLVVRWGAAPETAPQAGAVERVEVTLENAGTITWSDGINVAYHWLDGRDNAIVWDGYRTAAPRLEPGEHATVPVDVRAPIPPGPYRLAFDVVAEGRAWFSELGSAMLTCDLQVAQRDGEPAAALPADVEPAPDWAERILAAHKEGYGVVAGAVAWDGGLLHPRPRSLAAYEPGPGRIPGFGAPLLCPSVLPGIQLEPLGEVAGLPAFAAPPPGGEPWIYDGRIVVRVVVKARRRSGRPSA